MWMNRYEIENLQRRFDADEQPNAMRGTTVLNHLMIWTDRNSDGWAHWGKPSTAAGNLMSALQAVVRESYRTGEACDISTADLAAALRPIKAFLTRQKVDDAAKGWIVDPDASAKRAADTAAAALAARTEALHEEARQYARTAVDGAHRHANLIDMVADAYLAGANR